jgi:hypothetical protein
MVHLRRPRLRPTRVTFCLTMALAVATAIASVVGVQSGAQALPLATTCHGQNFLFDGWYTNVSPQVNTEGVSGNIRVEDGALCTNRGDSGNTTSTWVMVVPALSAGGGLAQGAVGVHRLPGYSPRLLRVQRRHHANRH